MASLLEVRNLKKNFEDFQLKEINFTMERGYIMGFIGPNGSGKSTTIKLILNLLKKDSGEIKVLGKDHIQYEKEIKNKIGFVLDENYFYEELTMQEMKRIIAPFYVKWDDSVFNHYMRQFGLRTDKKIKELSKGMKMKFSLALALSHNAELLIMDEPTSGLDPIIRSELLEVLSDLIQDENKGVFFSTHITSDLDKVADFITFLNNGEIVFSESKDDIVEYYGLVKGKKELLEQDSRIDFIGLRENKYGFEGLVKNKKEIRKKFGDQIIIERPSLDDIMLYFARGNQCV